MTRTSHPSPADILCAIDPRAGIAPSPDVVAHLAVCDTCQVIRHRLTTGLAVLPSAAPVSPSDRAELLASRRRLELAIVGARQRAMARARWQRYVAAAAVCVVAVLGARKLGDRNPAVVDAAASSPLPIAHLTPGATWDISAEQLCTQRGSLPRRIPPNIRARVLRSYGMEHVPAEEFELDFLITPELGGAADASNLWPERYGAHTWNALIKDDLERLLPAMVCRGEISLTVAQRDIAKDWIAAYKKYFRTDRPLPRVVAQRDDDDDVALAVSYTPRYRLISFAE